MYIYFTTVVRGALIEEGGELLKVDWHDKKIVGRVPIIPENPSINDPNKRGNSRGGRGILQRGERIYVANYHSLLIFDPDLQRVGTMSHGLFAGLHELSQTEDTIWAASTAIDAAVGVNDQGNVISSWWPRENKYLKDYLGVNPLMIDKSIDNRLLYLGKNHLGSDHVHLNAVTFVDNDMYVLLNRYGIVYNATKESIVIEDKRLKGAHNIIYHGGNLLVNDTRGRSIRVYNKKGVLIKNIELLKFSPIKNIFAPWRYRELPEKVVNKLLGKKTLAAPLFVRGLFTLDDNRVFVGFSPATIAEIDIEDEILIDFYQFSDDPTVCVHGLIAWSQ